MAPPAKDSDVIDGAKARRPYILLLPPVSFSTSTQYASIQLSISAPLQDKLSRMESVDTHSVTTFGHARPSPPSSGGRRSDSQSAHSSLMMSPTELERTVVELQTDVMGLKTSVRKLEDKLDAHIKKNDAHIKKIEKDMRDLRDEVKAGFDEIKALIAKSLKPIPDTPSTDHLTVPTTSPYNLSTTSTSNFSTASKSNLSTASTSNLAPQSSEPPLGKKKSGIFQRITAPISAHVGKRRAEPTAKDTAAVLPPPAQEPSSSTGARFLGQPIQPGRR